MRLASGHSLCVASAGHGLPFSLLAAQLWEGHVAVTDPQGQSLQGKGRH